MRVPLRKRLALGMLTALLVTGATRAAGAGTAPVVRIRYGTLGVSVSNLYQSLGIEKGIYRRHGIDLQLIRFLRGGPELVAAAASEQVDMGNAGTPILVGISRGLPIKVVGAPVIKGQPFILVARPGITQIAQLKGQRVGISDVGGGGAEALRYILLASHVDPAAVRTVAYGTSTAAYVVLKTGQVSAVVTAEPTVSRLQIDGVGQVLAEAKDYFGRYEHSYVFATRTLIDHDPAAIRAYFQANREAIDYARLHQDELLALGVRKTGLDRRVIKAALDHDVPQWDDCGAVDRQGLLNAVAIVKRLGDISPGYEPDFAQITDLRFLN